MKIRDIFAVVLCGGKGTRLKSAVPGLPKPLAPFGKKPFLDIIIRYLERRGVRNIVLSTGYLSEMIEEYYLENPPAKAGIVISREKRPLGTAGAVKLAAKKIPGNEFMVLNGDSFCDADLPGMLRFHESTKASATIAASRMKNIADSGAIETDGAARITGFSEKISSRPSGLVNAGIYIFSRSALSLIPANKKCSLEYDVFPRLRGCYAFITKERFVDIGTRERYNKAREILSRKEYQ